MSTITMSKGMRVSAAVAAFALLVTGCSGGSSSKGSGSKTVTMGVIPSWTDETVTAYIAENILKSKGYTVNITNLSDNAPLYTALSRGNIDVMTSSWKDGIQKSYWDKYSNKLEDLGSYYTGAKNYLAVPTYMTNVNSVSDLSAHASDFNKTITGIEPGAGLTKMIQTGVMPKYDLNKDFTLQLSSTVAMLTALKQATSAKKPIVVTLWSPFWANSAYPVKPLTDPKGAYSKPENLHIIAHKGFKADNPKVAKMLENFKLTQQQYESAENMIANKFPKGQEQQAMAAWLKENPDVQKKLASYLD